MSERMCEKCGAIEYGIWGYLALIGYSLMFATIGFAFASVFPYSAIAVLWLLAGMILFMPLYFISFKETRLKKKKELKNESLDSNT